MSNLTRQFIMGMLFPSSKDRCRWLSCPFDKYVGQSLCLQSHWSIFSGPNPHILKSFVNIPHLFMDYLLLLLVLFWDGVSKADLNLWSTMCMPLYLASSLFLSFSFGLCIGKSKMIQEQKREEKQIWSRNKVLNVNRRLVPGRTISNSRTLKSLVYLW